MTGKYLTAAPGSHYLTPRDNAGKALLLSLALLACPCRSDYQKTPILFQRVRVFDGLKSISGTRCFPFPTREVSYCGRVNLGRTRRLRLHAVVGDTDVHEPLQPDWYRKGPKQILM